MTAALGYFVMVSIRALSFSGCGFAVKGDEIAVNGRYRLSVASNF